MRHERTGGRSPGTSHDPGPSPEPDPTLDAALLAGERRLLETLSGAWARGWLPGELIRQAERSDLAGAGAVARLAVAADHGRRPPASLHPRWVRHVADLDLPPAPEAGWLQAGCRRLDVPLASIPDLINLLVPLLGWLRDIGQVIPPPDSEAARAAAARAAAGQPPDNGPASRRGRAPGPGSAAPPPGGPDRPLGSILERVRALLAQAESTTFEAEAETFTAKAQELMARHSLDAAMVWGRDRPTDGPALLRLPIEEPYLRAKTHLLHAVAASHHCKTVYYQGYALAVVVGFDLDLAATETLYTSLLIQSQVALHQAAAGSQPGDHVRSRSFRSSFLYAYANRIGQRLDEITRQVEADTISHGGAGDLLPVLADRRALVEAKLHDELGPVGASRPVRRVDASGWRAGARAADQAELHRRDRLGTPRPGLPPSRGR